ncbi:MAG TPA: PadR family transcriptional regulator [Candidatus Elarobacter sp.]|jgi:DNA-binding PadR family transcriptional regulator
MMFEIGRGFARHAHGRHGRRIGVGVWGFDFGKDWGGWRGGSGRPVRRGEMKFVILDVLTDGPKHGYEIITAIEQRRQVRPSAGSIYPTLQLLEDGGFVSSDQSDGKRVYTITDAGRALLADRAAEAEPEDAEDDEVDARQRLRESAMKLGAAVLNARGHDDKTVDKIREILDKARKEIYSLLASDES